MLIVGKDEPVFPEAVEPELPGHGRCLHGLEAFFIVESTQPADNGIGDNRSTVIADHTVGFIAGKFPDRKLSLLVIDGEHGLYEIHRTLRLYLAEQRMLPAEGVPSGKDRVPLPSVSPVDLSVHAAVLPVSIGVQGRMDGSMVEGSIEPDPVLKVGIRTFNFRKIFVPGLFSGPFYGIYAPWIIRMKILPRVFP